MSTLFCLLPKSPRCRVCIPLIKYLGLDIEIGDGSDPRFQEGFPLHRYPSLVTADGWRLHETIAILQYLTSQAPESCTYNFWGKTPREKAKVMQWVSFANTDCIRGAVNWMLVAKTPAEKAAAIADVNKCCQELENQLEKTRFLAGDEQTIADVFAVYLVAVTMDLFFDTAWFAQRPATSRWFREIADTNPIVSPELAGMKPKEL